MVMPLSRGAATALLLVMLAGCAAEGTAVPAPAAPSPEAGTSAGPKAGASEQRTLRPAGYGASWDAAGPSFGVDRLRWPGTAARASTLLEGLPGRLGGADRNLYFSAADEEEEFGAEAGVDYREYATLSVAQEYLADLSGSGKLERFTARNLLAAGFGLVFSCAEGSYRGTFPKERGDRGPGFSESSSGAPVWFSCAIDGAEGDEDFTGHAVGWTSGKTAWLVVARDRQAARALITELGRAAQALGGK